MHAGVLGALACGVGCEDPDPMNAQARYEAFERSTFFEDGRAMRPLVPDTVPREWRAWVVDAPGGETGLLPDGGWARRVPLPLTRALLEEGRTHYEVWCAVCHGLAGHGESIVARNMPMRRPPSLVAPHDHAREVVYGVAEDEGPYPGGQPHTLDGGTGARGPVPGADSPAVALARRAAGGDGGVSLYGRSQPAASGELPHPPGYYFTVMTEGYGVMPAYAVELSPRQRWAVVAWLRVLARSQRAPLEAAPPEEQRRLLQQLPAGEGQ
jgi:mono/diheme cytochrome c family protein